MGHSKIAEQKVAVPCESANSEESSSSMAYLAVESQALDYYCRVCWDSSETESELVSPCSCKGTQKYVHVKCLRRWQENVQKRDIRDERAFRCGVCQVRYTLAPPDPHFTTKLFQILRGLGGAACITLLAFGLAGPPWPHLALLALVLLGSRSHGMLAFALLASGTILAALHAKGLRLVMRFDDVGSPWGFAVVRHGAPVPGLGPGTLLVANNDLNHSIFKRSVVLIYQHDADGSGGAGGGFGGGGARGVILTQPMSSFFHKDGAVVENTVANLHDNENESELANLSTTSTSSISTTTDTVVQHRLGGPVGMPGEGARQEIAVLHTVSGIEGARVVILGEGSFPTVFIGGKLTDVLERGKDTALCNTNKKNNNAAEASSSSSSSSGSTEVKENENNNKEDEEKSGGSGGGLRSIVANRFKRSGISSKFPTPTQQQQQKQVKQEQDGMNKKEESVDCKGGSPDVLVFHGISTWTQGQLEGEIRAGAWAYGDSTFEDIMKESPSELWQSLMRSDRVGVLV